MIDSIRGQKKHGAAGRGNGLMRALFACLTLVAWGSTGALGADRDIFDGFVSPVSNPTNFEDPRAVTDVRTLYVYHKLSNEFGNELNKGKGIGGDAHVVAVQVRLAITDRLALIATKDGYVWLRPERVLENRDGFANLGFGLKYSFFRDAELGALATAGLRYEAPSGNTEVFQGQQPVFGTHKSRGDGVFNPFISAAWGLEDAERGDLHLMAYVGGRIPISVYDSSFFDVSFHADYGIDLGVCGKIYPLIELNYIRTVNDGKRLGVDQVGVPIEQEGFDFFNFGTTDSSNHSVLTGALGFRYRLFEGVGDFMGKTLGADLGAVYESPWSDAEDLFGWRVTTDITFFLS